LASASEDRAERGALRGHEDQAPGLRAQDLHAVLDHEPRDVLRARGPGERRRDDLQARGTRRRLFRVAQGGAIIIMMGRIVMNYGGRR
jgi:hypothetical protein